MVFNEEYVSVYDDLYQEKDYKKECDFIEAVFRKFRYKPNTILDLGCGTGGHALILAKRGYEITGVDRSKYMLELAKNKAETEGLKIELIEGDITSVTLNKKFDAVISMFAVMSYHITNSAISSACQLAKESLVDGGIFIFDCWHGPAVLADKPAPRVKELNLNNKEKIIRFTEPQLDVLNHTVNVNFKVCKLNNDNLVSENCEVHPMRFLFTQEIKYFLEVAGFSQVEWCPFLELDRSLEENDWNMAVIAKK